MGVSYVNENVLLFVWS